MKKLILLILVFVSCQMTFAQSPDGFKYQAVVRDDAGLILADQAVGFEITILQGSPTGTSVYQETFDETTNSYGLVSLDIGNGTVASGDFTTIDWGAGPYFMAVALDPTGGTAYDALGTSELLSVPYAMYARTAENTDDADADPANELNTGLELDGTDLNLTDGGGTLSVDLSSLTDGDLDTDPANELNTGLELDGTDLNLTDDGGTLTADLSSLTEDETNELIEVFEISDDSLRITEAGTVYSIALADLSGGDWIVSGDNIYNPNSGYVGIGTEDPASMLHVLDTLEAADTIGARINIVSLDGTADIDGLYVDLDAPLSQNSSAIRGSSINDGDANFNRGVYGLAFGNSFVNRGLQGEATGQTDGQAIFGMISFGTVAPAGGASLDNYGAYGIAEGSTNFNVGSIGVSRGDFGINNYGVFGSSSTVGGTNNYGVYGTASDGTNNFAGFFDGDVTITGDLDVTGTLSKGGGTFKIDHPLDPENKYLVHSFVESPDMMNIYNGNITTNSDGYATVELPDYFSAANKEFRYQLTVIGTFAQAIVKEKISGNTFVIQTNEPNVEVSWQVTGVRSDKWSDANRIEPELEKEKKGTYLHPELYNQSPEKSENFEHIDEKNSPASKAPEQNK